MSVEKKFITEELARLKAEGLYEHPYDRKRPGPWVTIEGRRRLNLCSNYLGLCSDERICERARAMIDAFGVGPGAVRTIAETLSLHVELERGSSPSSREPRRQSSSSQGSARTSRRFPPMVGKGDLVSATSSTTLRSSTPAG